MLQIIGVVAALYHRIVDDHIFTIEPADDIRIYLPPESTSMRILLIISNIQSCPSGSSTMVVGRSIPIAKIVCAFKYSSSCLICALFRLNRSRGLITGVSPLAEQGRCERQVAGTLQTGAACFVHYDIPFVNTTVKQSMNLPVRVLLLCGSPCITIYLSIFFVL